MKKILMLLLTVAVGLVITGCTLSEKAQVLETGYAIGKKGVQTFVSDEKRAKYHTKALDEVVVTGYKAIKKVKLKEE